MSVTGPLPEGVTLSPDLLVELEVGHEVDVLDPILGRHRDVVAVGLQQLHPAVKGKVGWTYQYN